MRDVTRELRSFGRRELRAVERAHAEAAARVSAFYVLAPRERERMRYEVRTLDRLAPEEITDDAFAEVRCYDRARRVGARLIERHDFYRICVQDHRILNALDGALDATPDRAPRGVRLTLEPLLLYILTHELVHVVRFTQRMQRVDLAPALRPQEESSVEQTTRVILAPAADGALRRVIETFEGQ
jgi:hypothetical protein